MTPWGFTRLSKPSQEAMQGWTAAAPTIPSAPAWAAFTATSRRRARPTCCGIPSAGFPTCGPTPLPQPTPRQPRRCRQTYTECALCVENACKIMQDLAGALAALGCYPAHTRRRSTSPAQVGPARWFARYLDRGSPKLTQMIPNATEQQLQRGTMSDCVFRGGLQHTLDVLASESYLVRS